MSRTTAMATTRGAALARPCTQARGEQRLEAAGDDAAEGRERIDREPDEQHRLAAEPVRQRPVEELADGEAET